MIKKLRKRFIWLALAVVAAVILVIVVGIDVANYLDMRADADDTIAFLEVENAMPSPFALPQGDQPQGSGKNAGKSGEKPKDLPGETAFSARYFTVETDANGGVTHYDLGRIAFVDASDVADIVTNASGERGFVGNYRYFRRETENGYHYFFLDCEKEIDACRTFIVISAIITSIGLAAIAILIILLSARVLAPVEESYKKQKQFITDAGHELKTPLTVIGANAELLELEIGEGNEWLESIKGQVERLSKLTKELVFLSRMDEVGSEIPKATFSLKSALEDCAEGFKEAALVGGKEIVLELEALSVNGNEEMIRRAASLLLDNAIKYAENDRITLTLRREGKLAVVETRNDASLGKGAHPELFERFYRPDSSRNTATGGHGVGLSVVKSIVEAHGGTACCESDGRELVIKLTIPM